MTRLAHAAGWYPSAGGSPERHYVTAGALFARCGAKVRTWEADESRPKCPSCAWSLRREQRGAA